MIVIAAENRRLCNIGTKFIKTAALKTQVVYELYGME
jgi:hypothetical protein